MAVGDLAVADLVGGDEPGEVGQCAEAGREPARLGKGEEPVAGGRPDRLARWAPGGPAQPQEHSRLDERIGDLIGHRGGLAGGAQRAVGIDGVQLGRQRRRQLDPGRARPCGDRVQRPPEEGDGALVDL